MNLNGMRAVGVVWLFVFIFLSFPLSAGAFELKWSARHDIDDLDSFSFDADGRLRAVGSELRFFAEKDGSPERPSLSGVEGLESVSDDRRRMARLVSNREVGEKRRYRLIVSEIGAGAPLFDSGELNLGVSTPKMRSSRNGAFHLVLIAPNGDEPKDQRGFLFDAETGTWARLEVPEFAEPLLVTDDGHAYVPTSEGLAEFGPDGQREALIAVDASAQASAPPWAAQSTAFSLSKDETRLAVAMSDEASWDDIIRIYDLERGEIAQNYAAPVQDQQLVAAVAITDTGVRIAIAEFGDGASRRVLVYDLAEGADPVRLFDDVSTAQHAFPELSPDGSRLAIVRSDGIVDLYEQTPASGNGTNAPEEEELPLPELVAGLGGLATLTDIAISPDNSLLAIADYQGQLWLWDLATGRAIRQFGSYDNARMAFTPDGASLEVLGGGAIQTFDLKTGNVLKRLEVSDYPPLLFQPLAGDQGYLVCHIRGCFYRPLEERGARINLDVPEDPDKAAACGTRLFFVTNDDAGPRLDVAEFDVTEPEKTRVVHTGRLEPGEVTSLACGPQGTGFAGTKAGRVVRFSGDGTVEASTEPGPGAIRTLAYLRDGPLLVGQDGEDRGSEDEPARVHVLGAEGLETRVSLPLPLSASGEGSHLYQFSVSDDGRRLVSVTEDSEKVAPNHIALMDLEGLLLTADASAGDRLSESGDFVIRAGLASGGRKPAGLTFSPDGERLAVSFLNVTAIWDLRTGQVVREIDDGPGDGVKFDDTGYFRAKVGEDLLHEGYDGSITSFALPAPPSDSPFSFMLTGSDLLTAGDTLAVSADEGTVIWPKATGTDAPPASYLLPAPGTYSMTWRSLDPSGNRLLIQTMDGLILQDVHNPADPLLWRKSELPDGMRIASIENAAFMPDGRHVLVPLEDYSSDYGFVALDTDSGEITHRWEKDLARTSVIPVRVSHPGNGPELHGLLKMDGLGFAEFLMVPEESAPPRIDLLGLQPFSATASPDGRLLVVRGLDDLCLLWDRTTGMSRLLDARLSDAVAPAHSVAFAPDGSLVAVLDTGGAVKLFEVESGNLLARLLSLSDGGWAVAGADGRYDASDPGNVGRLSWIVEDEPLYPVPVEAFIQEYYEPRLLARRIAGEDFAPLAPPQDKNRVTPEIDRIDIDPPVKRGDAAPTVTVRVAVAEGDRNGVKSGLGAVKLFRDGQLVALAEDPRFGERGRTELQFDGIALPPDEASVTFSAYAFNADGIKGVSAEQDYDIPQIFTADAARRAFVIAVGVNTYDNPAWNLAYAAYDAEATVEMLKDRLEASGDFQEVYGVPLLSLGSGTAEEPRLARRDVIEAVIGQLAGRPVDAALPEVVRARIPVLPKARPQDLVYIAFAGHGFAGADGRFHFFPQEFGAGSTGRQLTDELIKASLDSDRLTGLLRDIDARDMVLVIDACNSAASVEGAGFKPGPMGSKGLGQLAYDKSMRVLAASQAEAVALESDQLRHGALTYALLKEGLEAGQADRAPNDGSISLQELLGYSRDRVPDLYRSLRAGTFEPQGRGAFSLFEEEAKPNIPAQQPSLFDFRRPGREDVAMTAPE